MNGLASWVTTTCAPAKTRRRAGMCDLPAGTGSPPGSSVAPGVLRGAGCGAGGTVSPRRRGERREEGCRPTAPAPRTGPGGWSPQRGTGFCTHPSPVPHGDGPRRDTHPRAVRFSRRAYFREIRHAGDAVRRDTLLRVPIAQRCQLLKDFPKDRLRCEEPRRLACRSSRRPAPSGERDGSSRLRLRMERRMARVAIMRAEASAHKGHAEPAAAHAPQRHEDLHKPRHRSTTDADPAAATARTTARRAHTPPDGVPRGGRRRWRVAAAWSPALGDLIGTGPRPRRSSSAGAWRPSSRRRDGLVRLAFVPPERP